jgi:NADPH2:quinone reductase
MHAGWYDRTGPAEEVIETGEMPAPEPGPGEVLVRVHASGIDPSDYKRRANAKVAPEFPRVIPHSDGAGVVAKLGAGVTSLREGERVWVYNAQWQRPFGTAAEFVSLPACRVRPLPDKTSFIEGACLGIPAMTGYHAVHVAGDVKGKTVYVPGATGRVGAYAVQFAKWRGARVIASTGGGAQAREAVAAIGADVVLDRKAHDLETQIMRETEFKGVDHIVEVNLPANIGFDERILGERGAIVSFGAASVPNIPVTQMGRRARNMGLHFIFVYLLDEPTFAATCAGIEAAAKAGALKHRIGGTFPLAELARAHKTAETTSGTGHIVVEI